MTKHIMIELSEAQSERLEEIAAHEAVEPTALVMALIQSRLDYDARLRAAVEEARADIAKGNYFTHEEVVERGRERIRRLQSQTDQN